MSSVTIRRATTSLNADDLADARSALAQGRLLVVPTDTVYGIGCDAANPDAVPPAIRDTMSRDEY